MSAEEVQVFEISPSDFDLELLPTNARVPGSAEFKNAVRRFFDRNLTSFAGWSEVSVADDKIRVAWRTARGKPDPLDEVIKKLQRGEYREAIQLLRFLLPSRETDASIPYNLGMALSDMGELDEAEIHLRRAIELEPLFTNAKVALGVALQRNRKLRDAKVVLEEAVGEDPENPWASGKVLAHTQQTGAQVSMAPITWPICYASNSHRETRSHPCSSVIPS